MKKLLNYLLHNLLNTSLGSKLVSYVSIFNMGYFRKVVHKNIELYFVCPNWINSYRIKTFSSKEPETLQWIESIDEGSTIWDIGANVGLYSIYAAKLKKGKIYAFEPSVFNLEILARNVFLNNLQNDITIVPIPLTNKISENLFQMTSTQWGGALSTFGASIDQNGCPIKEIFEYKLIGISIDEFCDLYKFKLPDHIKIDVDGIEHLILSGANKVLLNVKSVLIEIDDNFIDQANNTKSILEKAGLILYKKCNIDSTSQFNQWWIRNN
jgi:FkbM family methyltransferase